MRNMSYSLKTTSFIITGLVVYMRTCYCSLYLLWALLQQEQKETLA